LRASKANISQWFTILDMKAMPRPNKVESEIAFVITDNGQAVFKDLASIRTILQYDLKVKPLERIHDTYFDTPEGLLRRRKTVLRIRQVNHDTLITVKSNPRQLKGQGIQRSEIELPWSRTSLLEAVKRLKLQHIPGKQPQFSKVSPKEFLARYGLQAIQERRTIRKVRNVVPKGKQRPVLAELALDSTVFIFRDTRVRIYEMEIEAKVARSLHAIQRIASAIAALHHRSVRYWLHGKFVTGLAIRELLKRRGFESRLEKKAVRAQEFRSIDQAIRSRRV
jgi:inorganic triphosphatase YgiF